MPQADDSQRVERVQAQQISGNLYRGEGGEFQGGPGSILRKRLEAIREARKLAKKKGGGGKGKAKGGAGAKPKVDAEAEAEKERLANVAAMGDALNDADNQTLSKSGLDGIALAASGQEPPPNVAEGLIEAGMAVRGEDGRYRLTSDGKAVLRAAESGDQNALLDKLSEVNDKNVSRRAKAAEAAEKEAEKEKKGGGGGGGGGKKEEKPDPQAEKRAQRRATAEQTAEDVGFDDLDDLTAAADAGGVENAALRELGLLDAEGIATDQGRRVLTALERGNEREYRAALQDARAKMEREQARQEAQRKRDARRDDDDDAGTFGEVSITRRTPRGAQSRMNTTTTRRATKHMPGGHDQRAHGRSTARRGASRAAYASARAGGASPAEARAAARDVSQVYAANQRLANIDKQLQGQVSDAQRRSLEAERARLQKDIETRSARTPAAQTAQIGHELSPVAPNVRGRQTQEQREWDTTMRSRAQDALEMRAQVDRDARATADQGRIRELQQRRSELDQIITGYREQGYLSHDQIRAADAARQKEVRDIRDAARAGTAPITPSAAGRGGDNSAFGDSRLRNLPQDLTQTSRAQQRALLDYHVNLSSAELRRRQLLNREQLLSTYDQLRRTNPGDPAYDRLIMGQNNLMFAQGMIMAAQDRQERQQRKAKKSLEEPLMLDYDTFLSDLQSLGDDLAGGYPEIKAGARHSATDTALLNQICEAACDIKELAIALGADEPDEDEDEAEEMEGGEVEMMGEETKTMDEEDSFVFGSFVKALDGDRVGALAVRFGSEDEPDMSQVRDYFTKSTDYWLDAWDRRPMLYHHALDEATRDAPRIGTWTKATVTNEGVWLEGQLDRAHRYYGAIKELIKRGVLRVSSDSAPHLVLREARANGTHEVKRWPLLAASLTPSPAEPRLSAVSFKALLAELGLEGIDDNPQASDVSTHSADGQKAVDGERARRLALTLDILALETAQ